MSVAVVIVNYNSAALLERCLQALSDQTERPDRVIVVDNNSSEPASQTLLSDITNAEVIRANSNLGYGAAINLAARELDDEFLCCLNPDAFPDPTWLEKLLKAARENPNYGSFASLMLNAEQTELVDGAGDELHVSGLPWRQFHNVPLSNLVLHQSPVVSACAGAAMYRLSDFRTAGGFDESFFMYVEDIDLGLRLQAIHRPCLFVKDAVVRHIGSAITGVGSDFSLYHGHRNLVWNYFKNLPWPLVILLLPAHLLMTVVILLRYGPSGKAGVIGRAKLHAVRGLLPYLKHKPRTSTRQLWPLLNKSFRRSARMRAHATQLS